MALGGGAAGRKEGPLGTRTGFSKEKTLSEAVAASSEPLHPKTRTHSKAFGRHCGSSPCCPLCWSPKA